MEIKKEKRLSRKMLINRLNRHLPFLRSIINQLRYITFRKQCPTYPEPDTRYSDGPWIRRKVTNDQKAIENYLTSALSEGVRLLHVGIGSSDIAKKWGSVCEIDGITVVEEEKMFADSLYIENYHTYLLDKNDIAALKNLKGSYDFILDNDIAAYACCKRHFRDTLAMYAHLLSPHGRILAGPISLSYFDSGFPMSMKQLSRIASESNLEAAREKDVVVIKSSLS